MNTKASSVNANENLAIIGFDINYLKRANDTLGHNAGDELIIATANLLKETFDLTDDNDDVLFKAKCGL